VADAVEFAQNSPEPTAEDADTNVVG
jgi:hypothetical protein